MASGLGKIKNCLENVEPKKIDLRIKKLLRLRRKKLFAGPNCLHKSGF